MSSPVPFPIRLQDGGLQDFFECFSWKEFYPLTCLDLDRCACLWIDSLVRFPCSNFESAEADQLNVFGFLNPCFDSFDYGADNSLGLSGARVFSEGFLDGFRRPRRTDDSLVQCCAAWQI